MVMEDSPFVDVLSVEPSEPFGTSSSPEKNPKSSIFSMGFWGPFWYQKIQNLPKSMIRRFQNVTLW